MVVRRGQIPRLLVEGYSLVAGRFVLTILIAAWIGDDLSVLQWPSLRLLHHSASDLLQDAAVIGARCRPFLGS